MTGRSSGDLFDEPELAGAERRASGNPPAEGAPLAERMRPRDLGDVVGPTLAGPQSFLRRAIEEDRVPSLVLWGPPGSGKTTIARLVAARTRARFVAFSAVVSGVKEVKAIMEEASRLRLRGQRTLLFVDEIHRFNRSQQDAFLPYVESGAIVLVGATTENPSFELNGALLSRLRVVVVPPLTTADIETLVRRAAEDSERGLGGQVSVDDEAVSWLGRFADGDARRALSALENAAAQVGQGGHVTGPLLAELFARKALLYDKSGEEHYNLISALHKSMRDSDVDASLYWLTRMLEGGEDPLYVARRLVRFASEDVGLAEPEALRLALAGRDAVHFLGMPEGALALAEVAIYLALAPKSNAIYVAYGEAQKDVTERPNEPPPLSIRNAVTKLMREVGYGTGYRYAHDTEEKTAGLSCLPDALEGRRYYRPFGQGREVELKRHLEEIRALRERLRKERAGKR